MDISSVEAFVKVIDCGSITKAASRLYMTPQGLSKAIRRMEEELGAVLFIRSPHGTVPTSQAQALYPKAAEFLQALEQVSSDANSQTNAEIRIAATTGTLVYLDDEFTYTFKCENPYVKLIMDDVTDRVALEMLGSGEAEIGFIGGPIDDEAYTVEHFMSFKHILVVHEANPLAKRESVRLADLANQTVTLLGRDYVDFQGVCDRLVKADVDRSRIRGVIETYSAMPLVNDNNAVWIGADYWQERTPWASTVVIPFEEDDFFWEIYLVTSKARTLTPAALAYRELALSWSKSHNHRMC